MGPGSQGQVEQYPPLPTLLPFALHTHRHTRGALVKFLILCQAQQPGEGWHPQTLSTGTAFLPHRSQPCSFLLPLPPPQA